MAALFLFTGVAFASTSVLANDGPFVQVNNQSGGPQDPNKPTGCDPANPGPECCDQPPPCCGTASPGQPGTGTGAGSTQAPGSHPVSVVNGGETLVRTDLVVNGVYPIQINRRYDNQSEYDSRLGYGWAFSFDLQLYEYSDGSVAVRNSCGYKFEFVAGGGGFVAQDGRQEALTVDGGGVYELAYPRGAKARFDPDGTLTELEDRSGNQLVFTYAAGFPSLMGSSPFALDPMTPSEVARLPQLNRIAEVLADSTPTGRFVDFTHDPMTGRVTEIKDHNNRIVSYAHDATASPKNGNLLTVTGLEGIVETYGYADPLDAHNLTSSQLGQGLTPWINAYDAEDRVLSQTRGTRVISFDYSVPLETTVTRPIIAADGTTVLGTAIERYEFDVENLLTLRVDAEGNEFRYTRDAYGFLERVEIHHNVPGGALTLQKAIDYVYDLNGNLMQRSVLLDSGEIVTEAWEYESHWVKAYQRSSSTQTNIFRTEYTFYGSGAAITNIKEIKRRKDNGVDFEITGFTYNANGQIDAITPPEVSPADGLKIRRNYFQVPSVSVGLLEEIELEVLDPQQVPIADLHLKRTMAYDVNGYMASATDARGNTTDYVWDDRGRLTEVKAPNPVLHERESTFLRYHGPSATGVFGSAPPGNFLSEVETGSTVAAGEGQLRRLRYDAEGRLDRVERKDDLDIWSSFLTYAYDSDDNPTRVTEPTADQPNSGGQDRDFFFEYDRLTRLVKIIDEAPTPNVTQFAYDASGNRTQLIDAKNRTTLFRYDDLDRLIEFEQQAESLTTAFAYDAAGNVKKVTDPLNQETAYEYDTRSRIETVTQHLTQEVNYTYDERGRLDTMTNARGQVLDYDYFAWGGVQQVVHVAATPARTVAYTYDLAGNVETTSDTATSGSPLYTYSYDELNRVDGTTAHYIPGGDITLASGYDRFGSRDSLDYTEPASPAFAHTWSYNDLGRLITATLAGGLHQLVYWDNDDFKQLTRPNGLAADYTYHSYGPLDQIEVQSAAPLLLHRLAYTPNAIWGIDEIEETRDTGGPETFFYSYDGVERLTQAVNPVAFVPSGQEDYDYDAAGNRQQGSPSPYAYDSNNRILASPNTSWGHDADGNVETRTISGLEERFTFDYTNRLRSWEKDDALGILTDSASYLYDPFGRRIQKTVNGATVWYLWDGDDLLGEYDSGGSRTRRYAYTGGFAPVEVIDPAGGGGETVYDVHTDHLNTPRMLTDSAGAIVWRGGHESFGKASLDPGNSVTFNVRFPGQYFDAETGLHYNRFRYYEPEIGRYFSEDPLGQSAGINAFLYAENVPTWAFDPAGLNPHNLGFPTPPPPPPGFFAIRDTASAFADSQAQLTPAQRDAVRHCVASCLAQAYHGSTPAAAAGWANEVQRSVRGGQTTGDRAMDDANNLAGRQLSCPAPDCEKGCLGALANGSLTTKGFRDGAKYAPGGRLP